MKKLSMNYQGKTYLRADAAMPIKPGKIRPSLDYAIELLETERIKLSNLLGQIGDNQIGKIRTLEEIEQAISILNAQKPEIREIG